MGNRKVNAKENAEEFLPHINRNYKDTLFRMIFKEKAELLSLYNAVNETGYTNPDELEVVTLENAIFMNVKNDLAFLFSTDLNLYEHQSTFCPNIPLRMLYYIAAEYQKTVREEELYDSKTVKIPVPKFVVFYNGMQEQADKVRFKLSDMFRKKEGEPELELIVTMLNINLGRNKSIMNACKTLHDYATFVALMRKYAAEMDDISAAAAEAVDECIKNDVLGSFLKKYRSEVITMSLYEYNEEKVLKYIRESEREQGYEEGMERGIEQGIGQGIEQGIEQKLTDMVKKKLEKGKSAGIIAEELDEDINEIQRIIEKINKNGK